VVDIAKTAMENGYSYKDIVDLIVAVKRGTQAGAGRDAPAEIVQIGVEKGLDKDTITKITHSDRSIGSRMVPALSVGAQSTGTTTVTIPTDITPGVTYYLGVCADDTGRNQELNENDNCVFIDYFQAT
jgi:hypothetical protein